MAEKPSEQDPAEQAEAEAQKDAEATPAEGQTEAEATETEAAETGAAETGAAETGAAETGAAETGAAETEAATGAAESKQGIQKVKGAKATGVREEMAEAREVGAMAVWSRELLRQTPSWLVSMVFHMVILLVLALWMMPDPGAGARREIVMEPTKEEDELEELIDEPIEQLEIDVPLETVVIDPDVNQEPEMPMADDMESAAMHVDLSELGLDKAPRNDLLATVGSYSGNALDGRGKGRGQLVAAGGGNEASERAVAMALKWLAEHQMPDGGWNFNHALCPKCRGQCRGPGSAAEARAAATGLALLPFLGAGQTHKTGKYKATVKGGLYFLVNRMKVSSKGGSLFEKTGTMYSHGLCSIALCEAYAMTHDKGLYGPAQQAVNFISYAQDPVGGGWRYQPRQAGDTSVVGWQIMALKSGHMAYLRIPPVTVKKAFRFLDTVQSNSGSNYGYCDPGSGEATTAIGLLCRMYLGWKKDNPALIRGAQWIAKRGPSKSNAYYNYYATQVMRHMEGEGWVKWNKVMRDSLVKSQVQNGHEQGSWHFGGDNVKGGHVTPKGGRLYCTAMATMILEVYYRHLPIYRTQSVEEDFPD